jgi:hypothetical protein
MALTKQEVSSHIREAFHGVTLGKGIGLLEGQGLDDYEDEATRKAYRERDEKHDWERNKDERQAGRLGEPRVGGAQPG